LIAALYEKGYTKIIQKEVIGEIETSADISAVGCFWNQITDSLCFIGEHSEVIAWMQVGESAWRKMF
jgi:hypothetical protein